MFKQHLVKKANFKMPIISNVFMQNLKTKQYYLLFIDTYVYRP